MQNTHVVKQKKKQRRRRRRRRRRREMNSNAQTHTHSSDSARNGKRYIEWYYPIVSDIRKWNMDMDRTWEFCISNGNGKGWLLPLLSNSWDLLNVFEKTSLVTCICIYTYDTIGICAAQERSKQSDGSISSISSMNGNQRETQTKIVKTRSFSLGSNWCHLFMVMAI